MRAVPEGVEWNWREDGFTFTPYDRKDDLGWSVRRINIHIGPRFRGRKLFGSDSGTEWGPIDSEPWRNEPKCDTYSRWWGLPLFGWEITVLVTDYA